MAHGRSTRMLLASAAVVSTLLAGPLSGVASADPLTDPSEWTTFLANHPELTAGTGAGSAVVAACSASVTCPAGLAVGAFGLSFTGTTAVLHWVFGSQGDVRFAAGGSNPAVGHLAQACSTSVGSSSACWPSLPDSLSGNISYWSGHQRQFYYVFGGSSGTSYPGRWAEECYDSTNGHFYVRVHAWTASGATALAKTSYCYSATWWDANTGATATPSATDTYVLARVGWFPGLNGLTSPTDNPIAWPTDAPDALWDNPTTARPFSIIPKVICKGPAGTQTVTGSTINIGAVAANQALDVTMPSCPSGQSPAVEYVQGGRPGETNVQAAVPTTTTQASGATSTGTGSSTFPSTGTNPDPATGNVDPTNTAPPAADATDTGGKSCIGGVWTWRPWDWVYVPVKCVFKWAFGIDQTALRNDWQQMRDAFEAVPPGSWIVGGGSGVASFFNAFSSGGCGVFPDFAPHAYTSAHLQMPCEPPNAGWAAAKDLMGGAMVLGTLLWLWTHARAQFGGRED